MTAARVGIDVGGTKCLAVALGPDDEIIEEERRPTPRGAPAILATLLGMVAEMGSRLSTRGGAGTIGSLGLGVPGLVNREGTLVAAPNLVDIEHFEVGRLLREALDPGVVGEISVDNDATCAAVAEWRAGAARGVDDAVMVTLGTGIGGGVIAGGRLLRGAHGFAGEFGHMVLDPDGPPCPCGRSGCWERFASGSALGRLGAEAAAAGRSPALVASAGSAEAIRGEHVRAAALAGDPGAVDVVDDFARWTALGLVNLTNLFDPSVIVLGGGLAESADLFLAPIERWFAELLYSADLRPKPVLRFAALGEHAGAVGAAMLIDAHHPT